jgi:hypothetical protein
MHEGPENQADAGRRMRLAKHADRMLESGRITEPQAARLREAGDADEVEDVIRDIRATHAGTALSAAVQGGRLSQDEADGYLQRLRNGEHSSSLRARLRALGLRLGAD